MGEEDSGDKTEEPTPHKLREAREKGQIAKSKDITSVTMIFVSFFTLKASVGHLWEEMDSILRNAFGYIPLGFSESVVGNLLKDTLYSFLIAMAPLFAVTFITALMIEALQTGFLFSMSSIAPKLEKLNPIEGFKKFFALKQYVELVKSAIKMAVVIWLIYGVIVEEFPIVILAQSLEPWQVMTFTGNLVMKVVVRVGMFYIAVAVFDYFYQQHEHLKSMKMTKKEIKDEYKRLEGDPQIKQRQKEAARQMSMGRQMGAVPGADVVVTNPTHIAIALAYKPDKMKAPVVVAKGKLLIAETIKRIAAEHNIVIVENVPLARALFPVVEVDTEVPPQYYKAVAQILAFVYNLRKKRGQRQDTL
jgi:flagellar biosynthetic protein FlhB